ncbi:hypothetical protein AB0M44_37430 [Streptosporangium subroseum]|uniref:hypothetical protein n=1 Tax=Streptosporangium subroseum TaxID=106412 RepID=UPI003415C5D2
MTHQSQEWDQLEDGRRAFREARRELDWSANHYRQARYAIAAGNGSSKDLSRAQQSWSWALAEWVRALTYREEALDGVALDAGLEEDPMQSGEPSPASMEFQKSRQEAEARSSHYTRVRRSNSSPADVVAARNAWGEALTRWSRALISRERSQDNHLLGKRDDRDLIGAGTVPGAFGPDTSPRVQEIVEESRAKQRANNLAETNGLPKGKPLPLGRSADSILSIAVSERNYQFIVTGRISVVTEVAHREARRLRAGAYVGIVCRTAIHYSRIRRITAYASALNLVESENRRWLDPERTSLQLRGICQQQLVFFRIQHPAEEPRGLLAIELTP